MSLRRAIRDDLPRIAEIRHAVRENRLSRPDAIAEDEVLWFLDNPGIWVWDEDGRVLGFSAGDTRDGWIWALFIDPEQEGRGIGRALFAKACQVVRTAGHTHLRLRTSPGTRAARFYEAQGWRVTGTLPGGEVQFEFVAPRSARAITGALRSSAC
jgi:GNAT superfamily N-acetyltransferase